MNPDLMETLVCPLDRACPLDLLNPTRSAGQIETGELVCEDCGVAFPVIGGIPRFLVLDESEESKTKRDEIKARDVEWRADYTLLETGRLPEIDAFRSAVGNCSDARALDAGCGTGVMTPVLGRARRIVGMDFSVQGLLNFRLPPSSTLDLLQGDVCQMPFPDGSFDLAISSQVLEHIPSQTQREEFIGELRRVLGPDGRLVISVYNWHCNRPQEGMEKEGRHSSGIFYHCYSPDELVAQLSEHFTVDDLWGVNVTLPKTYRLVRALGRANYLWDRLWRKKKIALSYCHLLLAVCRT